MTTPTPRWTAEELERIAREITRSWMTHLGYIPEQIAAADAENPHTADCEFDDSESLWCCIDENANSLHPAYDELCEAAALVMFVLEHPALAGVLTAVGGETRPIWRTRNLTSGGASVHWTRESADNAMAFRSRPGVPWDPPPDPYVLETAEQTTCPDGTVITSPWQEVTDDPA